MSAGPDQAGPPRLFVYGTLQPGRLRWRFLAPYAVGHRATSVPGALFDSGYGWPVADFGAAGRPSERQRAGRRWGSGAQPPPEVGTVGAGRTVPGVLVELDPDRLEEALARIDQIERTATDLLRRIVVTTVDGDRAWTYDCPHPEPGFTPIDRWDRPDER